jgi:septum site-determining protein MinD
MGKTSRVISVFGAKGGVGQTLIATNLAIALQGEIHKPVALIDLNFHAGDEVALLFNLSEKKSLLNLLPFIDRLSEGLIKGYLVSHPSGVELLSSIPDSKKSSQVTSRHIDKLLHSLRGVYPYTVINTENTITDRVTSCFDNSDLVLLIITPELLSLKRAQNFLDTLQSLHFPPQRIKTILNMSDMKGGLPGKEIESYLGQEILGEISYDPETVIESINKASPAILISPRSHFSKGIRNLASLLVTEEGLFPVIASPKGEAISTAEIIEEEKELISKVSGKEVGWSKEVIDLKVHIHKRLIEELDLKSLDLTSDKDVQKQKEIRETTKKAIEKILAEEGKSVTSREERTMLVTEILDECLGLGPLEKFIRDPSISEIMVNGKDRIYIEREGKIILTDEKFTNEQHLLSTIERIVTPLGRRIDESSPLVDARLKDGSRVNAIIPPLSLVGPVLTIRKFIKRKPSIDELVDLGTLTREMGEFLRICVQLRKNIVISGGTSSGKTTLLNIASSFIPEDERIITVEDSAELSLPQEHVVSLESRPPNIEGEGAIPIRRLIINCLRMRPDRIVVGECRGGEAIDMLQAMNTGHDGSLTTIHANGPRDALSRLETLVLMSGMELPVRAIREQIASAIGIIVQQARFSDGSRKITHITEVTGWERDVITTADIFRYEQKEIDEKGKVIGEFRPTGVIPTFIREAKSHGIAFDMGIFEKK